MDSINLDMYKDYVGHLTFKGKKGGRQVATGFLTRYRGKDIVITSGHCIFDVYTKFPSKDLKFKSKDLNIEFSSSYVLKLWTEKEGLEYDVAVLIPKTINANIPDCNINFELIQNPNKLFMILSFLSHFSFRGPIKKEFYGQQDELFGSTLIGFQSSKKGGLSGSPVFYIYKGTPILTGVVSLSFKQKPDTLWFAQYNNSFKKLLNTAVNSDRKLSDDIEIFFY